MIQYGDQDRYGGQRVDSILNSLKRWLKGYGRLLSLVPSMHSGQLTNILNSCKRGI